MTVVYVLRRVHFDGSCIEYVPECQYHTDEIVNLPLVFATREEALAAHDLLWKIERQYREDTGVGEGDFHAQEYHIYRLETLSQGDVAHVMATLWRRRQKQFEDLESQ